MSESTKIDLQQTAQLWEPISRQLEAFLDAWEGDFDVPPTLADYVLPGPGFARSMCLIELIKADLEYRWSNGLAKFIEDYVAEFPELADNGGVSYDLLYEEFHVRRQAGDEIDCEAFLERFPEQSEKLRGLLQLEAPDKTTSLVRRVRADVKPGDVLDDFLLLNELGEGAFAQVFLARQQSLNRIVALKISSNQGRETQTLAQLEHPNIVRVYDEKILSEQDQRLMYMQYVPGCTLQQAIHYGNQVCLGLDSPQAAARDSRLASVPEAETAVAETLVSNRVTSSTDTSADNASPNEASSNGTSSLGEHPRSDSRSSKPIGNTEIRQRDGGKWIVAALDQVLERRGETHTDSLPRQSLLNATNAEAVCRLGIQLAEALAYAHSKNVLHRDIKPANILLSSDATPKLVDFNISYCSKLEGVSPETGFGGSLPYMSPEQLQASNPDHERSPEEVGIPSDIYSLAVVLWEVLCGQRPFVDAVGDGGWLTLLDEMTDRRLVGPDDGPLRAVGCPHELRRLLLECLSPDPAQRPQSAEQLVPRLKLCLHPAVAKLVAPENMHDVARRYSWYLLFATVVFPNIAAAVFNFVYNSLEIVRHLNDAQDTFFWIQSAINATAFPIGMALIGYASLRPSWICQGDLKRQPPWDWLNRWQPNLLRVGHWYATVGIIEWGLAAIAYPVTLTICGVPLTMYHTIHFVISLTLCGLIVMAYPFFFATTFLLHYAFPLTLRDHHDDALEPLETCQKMMWTYIALAALVPMTGVFVLIVFTMSPSRMAMMVLSLVGLIGFVTVLMLFRVSQQTIAALIAYLRDVRGVDARQ